MEDIEIIDLYFDRSEQAIVETDSKYGSYCYSIAYNILSNREDSEESVSDTYMAAWKSIPPRRPRFLSAFLGKLTRHISIDRWRRGSAKKRGSGEIILALEELENCVDVSNTENTYEQKELTWVLNQFLSSLSETERKDDLLVETMKYINARLLSDSNYDAIIPRSNDEKNFNLDEIHLVPYLNTIKELKKIYRVLPHKPHIFKNSKINKELYRNLCDKLLRKYNIKNDEMEFACAYFNYGVLAIIDKWVESDCKEDVSKIANLIIKLISL